MERELVQAMMKTYGKCLLKGGTGIRLRIRSGTMIAVA